MFGAKRDDVTGEWRKLHNTELHALYSSPDIIRNIKSRRLRWAGHVALMGESTNAYRVLVGRPERKISLERPRLRWEDNIKMDLREVEYDDRDWINFAQDRDQWRAYVRAAINLRSPDLNPIEYLWDELDRRLRSREIRAIYIVQLSAMLQEEWRRIPMDILHKLVESMPDKVTAVIATRGDSVIVGGSVHNVGRLVSLPRGTQCQTPGWISDCDTCDGQATAR
ncbi:hypothetical protein ANN_22059 [Periplaneta americana]|uniref:Uncharacterized protein n=1 Tax=Periplaneta americana TaxID=6978 RepID=A0ABQ8S7Y9_PERAM|nr:hypothetical protein ANN_22059 [Periplaneta americana]